MLSEPFIERACTIEHDGRTFEAGGASIIGDRAVVYVGPLSPELGPRRGYVTTWHGTRLGAYVETGHSRGFWGSRITHYRVKLISSPDSGSTWVGKKGENVDVLRLRRAAWSRASRR